MTEEEKKAIIRRLVDEDRERTFRDRHSTTEDVLVEGDKVAKSLRSGFRSRGTAAA
jgi:hypothetical protein